jgi:peptidoglycan glycosyltransferase
VNRQVRRVALIILIFYGIVYLNLNRIQLVQAEKLANDPRNVRLLLKEYSSERGAVVSADGKTLAQSKPTPQETLKYLREYPLGPLFAQSVGYYSVVFGRDRIERTYNRALTGAAGVLTVQDIGDRFLGKGNPGDTVELAIDSEVQQAATAALGNRKGAVVAIDPETGEILAMVSSPSFDPNPISGHNGTVIRKAWDALQADPDKPLLNRATSESYPPGSTFKVVTAAAALEHGKPVTTTYPSQAQFVPPQTDKPIGNFGNHACGGDMADALRASCNTYFAHLGADLAPGDLEETARNFGFGETPPLDVQAARSRVPSADDLRSPAFRAQSAIGQFDVSATPLQMALVAAGIANGGQIPKPRLAKRVRDFRGIKVETFQPEIWKEAISKETADTLTRLMVDVVDNGTGKAAAIPGVKVAGKTGTAQTREGEAPHAWFICFAPADKPRIAMAVVVEHGGDLGNEATGGKLAAPIAKAVLEAHRKVGLW